MTIPPDSPKDQSPSTLAEEFERRCSDIDNGPGRIRHALEAALGRWVNDNRIEFVAALRSPTREAARSEALKEAADAADDEACASCRGCKTFSTRILALQDRATSGTTGRPDPGQGELNYYRAEGTGTRYVFAASSTSALTSASASMQR